MRIRNRGDVSIRAVAGLAEATAELISIDAVDLESVAPQFHDHDLVIDVPASDRDGYSFSLGSLNVAGGPNRPRIDVRVQVPEGSSVHAQTDSGDVSLSGSFGGVELKTGEGDVSVETAGRATCSTGSGDVSLRHVENDAVLSTGAGDIQLESNRGAVKATTGSGDVSVGGVFGEGKLSAGSGDLTLGVLDGRVKMNTGSGDFTVREFVQGSMDAKTASGDINVGVRPGVPVWTNVTTMTGDVHSGLRGAGEPVDGQPSIEITATTVSGDISLVEV